jgi:hypothetical protein
MWLLYARRGIGSELLSQVSQHLLQLVASRSLITLWLLRLCLRSAVVLLIELLRLIQISRHIVFLLLELLVRSGLFYRLVLLRHLLLVVLLKLI